MNHFHTLTLLFFWLGSIRGKADDTSALAKQKGNELTKDDDLSYSYDSDSWSKSKSKDGSATVPFKHTAKAKIPQLIHDDTNVKVKKEAPPKTTKAQLEKQEYHYPYRPKFPAHPLFGMCKMDDFQIDKENRLGKGGFGQVFKAVHQPTGRIVAIKYISATSIANRPKHVENEEVIHRILSHPNIGRLYCTMRNEENDIFFVNEYFDGGNMADQLQLMYPIPDHILAKYIAQIILALRYLHSHCIIYRDIKAENVMLDEGDNVKLIDFGLSVYDCDNKMSNLAGTLEYVAPEVAGRRKYGRAADYYSLAVMVYLLRTKKLPHKLKRKNKEDQGKNNERDIFAQRLASGNMPIPSTGHAPTDELIRYLSAFDAVDRWNNVQNNFETLKRLEFFKSVDWPYYEDLLFQLQN